MSQDKTRKARLSFTPEQKLECPKLMVVEDYSTRQVMEISGATAVARWKKQYEQELKGHTPEGKKGHSLVSPRHQRIKLIARMNKVDTDYSINELCTAFNVKHSTYYYHHQNAMSPEVLQMITIIKATSTETNNAYGKRRMLKVLNERGHDLGIYKTASLMKKADVVAIRPTKKHYYPTTLGYITPALKKIKLMNAA